MALVTPNAVATPNTSPNTQTANQTQTTTHTSQSSALSSNCFIPMGNFGSANAMMAVMLQLVVMLLQQLQGQEQQSSGQNQCQNNNTSTGNTNTGNTNTGNTNTGNTNTGNTNTGNTNTGNTNTGNTNTGNTNTGNTTQPITPPVPQTCVDAIDDKFSIQEGQTATGNVLTNDTQQGSTNMHVGGHTQPANGTVTVEKDGSFTYTPNPGFSGQDSFEYTICDDFGKSDTAKVDINVDKKPDPVGVDDGSKIWGDPHFVGAEGGKYDVQGEAGKTYNILSDANFQINSTFSAWGSNGATVMGEIGATIGDDQVQIAADGGLTINGETKGDGTYELESGTVIKEGNNVTMQTAEYEVTAKSADSRHGDYLNLDFASDNVNADGIMPHGLWGQTADGDGEARNGDRGAGAQGGGAIETLDGSFAEAGDKSTVKLYEVDGIFDTQFEHFNQFND